MSLSALAIPLWLSITGCTIFRRAVSISCTNDPTDFPQINSLLETKTRAIATKMGIVKEARFGLMQKRSHLGDCYGESHGTNFSSLPPVVWIEKEAPASLGVIAHELGHIKGYHGLQKLVFETLSFVSLFTVKSNPYAFFGMALGAQAIKFAMGRWHEKQADLEGAKHLEPADLAPLIHLFATDAQTEQNTYAYRAPRCVRWLTQFWVTKEGNSGLLSQLFGNFHPAATDCVKSLTKIYEAKTAQSPIQLSLNGNDLPQDTVQMIRQAIKESSRKDVLFDTFAIRMGENNVVFETNSTSHSLTVDEATIENYKAGPSQAALLAIVSKALATPKPITLSISSHFMRKCSSHLQMKVKLKKVLSDEYDADTITFLKPTEPGKITIQLYKKQESKKQQ